MLLWHFNSLSNLVRGNIF